MWVDTHNGVSHALGSSWRSLLCGSVSSRIFLSFFPPKAVIWRLAPMCSERPGGVAWQVFLLRNAAGFKHLYVGFHEDSVLVLGCKPGSSAAQGSFAAARQTLRHVGESNLIWLFCISKLLFGYDLWHEVCLSEVCMHRRAEVAGAKYCTGLADCCVLGLFVLFLVLVKN